MTIRRSLAVCVKISRSWIIVGLGCGAFHSSPARADRVLDLKFWAAEQSELALGGLWEFHAQRLLEPWERLRGSELLLEISQPWRDFRPLQPGGPRLLDRGSYVMFMKGLKPRPEGYAVRIASPQSMTRIIVAPKYAPERGQRTGIGSFFVVFPWLRTMVWPEVRVGFSPGAWDEIWMVIIQRWQTEADAVGTIPRLQWATAKP